MNYNQDKCHGCGVMLQDQFDDEAGYTQNLANDYCMGCFKLKNYGIVINEYNKMVAEQLDVSSNDVVLFCINVLYLEMIFKININNYYQGKDLVFIITQIDLLPNNTNLEFLYLEIKKSLDKANIKYSDIFFVSSIDKVEINELRLFLKTYYNKRDIYLMGVLNSGKTTIANNLLEDEIGLAMPKAGLTLKKSSAPFNNGVLTDMPGFLVKGYLYDFLKYEDYKKILISKKIKPKIYQVGLNNLIIINSLVGITYKKGTPNSFVFYINNDSNISRGTAVKLEHRLNGMENPTLNKYKLKFIKQSISLEKKCKYQITLADMGFILINGSCTLELLIPKGFHIDIRESLYK